jgi:hypothetical protein
MALSKHPTGRHGRPAWPCRRLSHDLVSVAVVNGGETDYKLAFLAHRQRPGRCHPIFSWTGCAEDGLLLIVTSRATHARRAVLRPGLIA